MKNLKKNFGKFAISPSKAIKINGGNGHDCTCSEVVCQSTLPGFYTELTRCQEACCYNRP